MAARGARRPADPAPRRIRSRPVGTAAAPSPAFRLLSGAGARKLPPLVWLLTIAAFVVLGWFVLRRANELCAIRLSGGDAHLVRGRAPAPFLADVAEVARRAPSIEAVIRVVTESGTPRVLAPAALPDAVVQQLRNVTGQYRAVQFRSGRRAP
jgi:hypothetical protein